ncbi:redoxin family protein, partial [Myxococcota bacterium]|nr:redoxin family protein [Myxococcota bacterium]
AGPSQELGVVGAAGDPATRALVEEMQQRYLPFAVLARVAPGEDTAHVPWMAERTGLGGAPTAYLCEGYTCRAPVTDLAEWTAALDRAEAVDPRARAAEAKLEDARVRAPRLPSDPALWLGSSPLALDELRGNVVVLDFWTFCCINCMHVLPELAAIEARFADAPVTVIGVHAAKFPAEKEVDNVRRAMARHAIHHPVVVDSEHELWSEYAVNAWPTIVVLDVDGRVAWKRSGEVHRDELGAVVERLLAEARDANKLAGRAAPSIDLSHGTGALAFPGKIHVSPDPQRQALGRDPFGPDGRVYVSDSGHHRILEAALEETPDGWPRLRVLRTFGGGEAALSDGTGSRAAFRGPQGIFRHEGQLWVADTENHALRVIDLGDGTVRTVAGTGERGRGGRGDPSRPRSLALRSPWDVAVLEGGVLVAMAGAHQIWVYLPDRDQLGPMIGTGRESHVDGPVAEASLAQPSGLALHGPLLFFADSETSSIRVANLEQSQVATLVGRGLFDFGDVDGTGEAVRLQHPLGVAFADGLVFVADTYNGKVKTIDVETNETKTLTAGLTEPGGLAVAGGFVLVADTGAHRLCAIHRETGELRPVEITGL